MPKNKKESGKPKGRVTAYAYFLQACHKELKKHQNSDKPIGFQEFSKSCGQRWQALSPQEKAPFTSLSEIDLKRYYDEMRTYAAKDGGKVKGRRKWKEPRDPNEPKRPISAFFRFSNDERSKVRAANPEYALGDVAKELGRMWAKLDPQIKQKYYEMNVKDTERYAMAMKEFNESKKAALQASNSTPQVTNAAEESEGKSNEKDDESTKLN